MTIEAAIHDKAIQFCGDAVEMCAAAGSGHPTTAMSISHITAVLTHHAMRWVPSEPWHPGSDRLVLSEGHAVPAVYAALADLGAVGTAKRRVGQGFKRPAGTFCAGTG